VGPESPSQALDKAVISSSDLAMALAALIGDSVVLALSNF
jgi:hypothetical protein